jgi:hypothetical protein
MTDPDLTPAQMGALDKAWDMLEEHFDHVLLLIDTEAPEGEDRVFQCGYHGGITAAIGLCERAKIQIVEEIKE